MKSPIVLVIDDNDIHRKLFKEALESEDYYVVEANDGQSALIQAQEYSPQLILQDLVLPDMNEAELIEKLRALPNCREIPIIAITSFLSKLEYNMWNLGFNSVLLKPVSPSRLIDVVNTYLPATKSSMEKVGEGIHLLIADDNKMQLKVMQLQLESLGFKVNTANSGNEAITLAQALKPDVIISDILMPYMDGFELCSLIRRNALLKATPIILLTAHYLEENDRILAKKAGANAYLTRTPDYKNLVEKIRECFDNKSSIIVPETVLGSIKEEHRLRVIRQLEQQTINNIGLSQQCAQQAALLSFNSKVVDELSHHKDIIETLQNVLPSCLDAAGIFKSALYIKDKDLSLVLECIGGYSKEEKESLRQFFGHGEILSRVFITKEFILLPSLVVTEGIANDILKGAKVKSALLMPIMSHDDCIGVLFIGSEETDLTSRDPILFVQALGMQIGQCITMANAFTHQ